MSAQKSKANRANTDAWTGQIKRSAPPAKSVWERPLNEVLGKQDECARKARHAIRVVKFEE